MSRICIAEDSRQKLGKHNLKAEYFEKHGIKVIRSKLAYGDYALMPERAVDTKKDIYELAYDIDSDHQRFKAELVGARDAGCKLYILVENEEGVDSLSTLNEWQEPMYHFEMRKTKSGNPRTRRIEGSRLAKACKTMSERYGATFLFCAPEHAGYFIERLLEKGGGD